MSASPASGSSRDARPLAPLPRAEAPANDRRAALPGGAGGAGERHFLTIGRKLGLVFLLLAATLCGVAAVVLHDLAQMRADAQRWLEEAREEQDADAAALALVEAQALDGLRLTAPPAEATRLRARIAAILEQCQRTLATVQAHRFAAAVDSAHESTEDRLVGDVQRLLTRAREELERDAPVSALPEARRVAAILKQETTNESGMAHADLLRRARDSERMLIVLSIGSALVLLGLLFLVVHQIVRPLRTLRFGSELFGRGHYQHRIPIRSRDEIGDVARAFNRMADAVQSSHGILEGRVRARTREFLRAAKLADLGTLAAGVAHEINNPLASIASCAEGLERRLERGVVDVAEQREYLQTIAKEAYRAHEITARLLAFARADPGPRTLLSLPQVVDEALRMVRHQLEQKGVVLDQQVAPELPQVRGNAVELKQVFYNLLLNALDATPSGARIALHWECPPRGGAVQRAVHVVVVDEGAGIPADALDRIFDPFFTTKEPGKGTGLGLSVAYGIVRAHGGELQAENRRDGHGATFRVTLPVYEPSVYEPSAPHVVSP